MDAFTIADVSFWGPYTITASVAALGLWGLFLWGSITDEDPSLFGGGFLVVGTLWVLAVCAPGWIGQVNEIERLKTEEMSRIGYENLTWNGDEFTGSKDGYYVVGFIKQHGEVYYVTDITRKGEMI